MAKKPKKKTKRSQTKYPGLNPALNKGSIRDFLDFDYLDQLSPKDKEFLNKFATESYSADFRGDKPLYTGKKKRRQIYRENNSRNNDMTSYLGNYRRLESFEDLKDYDLKTRNQEDSWIELIDIKNKKKLK